MNNPYLDSLKTNFDNKSDRILDISGFEREGQNNLTREDLISNYAWAIPNEEIISEIVTLSPIIEMGAGNGYWAYLIDSKGGDIIAYDNMDRSEQYNNQWYNVRKGSSEIIQDYPDRTLLLCWPEYNDKMGEIAVENYQGDYIVLIGERRGGCTGNDEMYRQLKHDWVLENEINIPNWFGIYDTGQIYSRYDN